MQNEKRSKTDAEKRGKKSMLWIALILAVLMLMSTRGAKILSEDQQQSWSDAALGTQLGYAMGGLFGWLLWTALLFYFIPGARSFRVKTDGFIKETFYGVHWILTVLFWLLALGSASNVADAWWILAGVSIPLLLASVVCLIPASLVYVFVAQKSHEKTTIIFGVAIFCWVTSSFASGMPAGSLGAQLAYVFVCAPSCAIAIYTVHRVMQRRANKA